MSKVLMKGNEAIGEAAIRESAAKESCKTLISIEMSMGQMVEDVERSVQGQKPVQWYGKCGGEVPTPEEIMEVVQSYITPQRKEQN